MKRQSSRRIGALLIGMLLFGQMAVAAYACPAIAPAAGSNAHASVPQASGERSQLVMADCAAMGRAMDSSSANLCAAHCQFGDQSNPVTGVAVPATMLAMLYITPPVPEMSAPSHPVFADAGALAAASPPHAILHCTFRI